MAKVALLIGVSEYEPGLNALPAAVNDVAAIQELLLNPEIGGFNKADVLVLNNPERQAMEESIEALFAGRHKDDLVLFFFSGHGIKDDAGRLFLATRSTRKTAQGDLIRSTAVSSNILHDCMNRSRSRRQVIILDSCFSGAFAEGLSAKDDNTVDIPAQLGGEGRAILTSSSSTQYSFEHGGSELSLYTRFLVEGIKTGAADQDEDEVISVDELHEYASRKVREIRPQAKPEIFPVRDGSKIRLVRVPPGDPHEKYRKEVMRYIRRGELSLVGRRTLDWKQTELGLSSSQAKAIEDEVLEPYRQRFRAKLRQYEQAFSDLLLHHGAISEEDRTDLQNLQQELELRKEDTLPIEAKVDAQFKARQQKLQTYEQAFLEAIHQEYPLGQTKRNELQQLLLQLELGDVDVALIETRITAEMERYHRNLKVYQQSFAAAIQEQFPLTDAKRHELREQQQNLGLKDIDVAPIEARITTEIENYQQKLDQYRQAFINATQRRYQPSDTVRTQLQQTSQALALKEPDVRAIESEITTQINLYQENLRQYEREFIQAAEQQYPLSGITLRELNQRQTELNLADEDIEALKTPIIAGIEDQLKKCQQYEQVFSESIQYEYPLVEETRDELKRFQKVLGLSDKTVAHLEGRLLSSRDVQGTLGAKSAETDAIGLKTSNSPPPISQSPTVLEARKLSERRPAELAQRVSSLPRSQATQPSSSATIAEIFSRTPKKIFIFSGLAIAGLLLSLGVWSLTQSEPSTQTPNNLLTASDASPQTQPASLEDRMSSGNKILIKREGGNPEKPEFEVAKAKGAAAMAKGDYEEAAAAFTEALKKYPNAPETLIYLNNARIGSEKSYEIAVSVPITGDSPGRALEMLRGFAQAQNEINEAGGINGARLKLKIFDDSDDPKITEQVASTITGDPTILAVLGHWSSNTSLAAVPAYIAGKIPFITPVSTTIELSHRSPYVFRTNLNTSTGGKALANYAVTKLRKTKVAIFFDSRSQYSKELESEFSKVLEKASGNVTNRFDLSDQSFSIANSLDQAMEKGADAIMLVPAPDTVNDALQVITANRGRLSLIGDIANLYTPKTLEVGGEEAVGMVMALAWHSEANPNSGFSHRSVELWKAPVSHASATSYNATQAIIEALRRQKNPSREGIQEALRAPNFFANGASGDIRFSPSGDANTATQFVEVRPKNKSTSPTSYEFAPIP
ncbi:MULTISPECIES: ABC transporter substrate-binding protein [unclassified Leptolyngbya]|uniref:caspase, EACC1-associated type n=1 Tax=unclassified Leptolyngbya TaxID=2650499 RepID=UPI0016837035|nr:MULTISPECIES: ABC transporter substrate-binding protein [unclassified Leptolyngbya]MBD1909843.1 ABC transporter substrate-binding protein [Leptolyngbya sp. FACHB-8]MBD2158994.1 ABC transporter substrate-binding protein [Leptolyngbya sp. FACHB-16]